MHDQYRDSFEGRAEIAGTVAESGAREGFLVDKAGADEFDIDTIDDFKRPEVKEAYDRNGDGKADLVACPPGWDCQTEIDAMLDAYELRDHINEIQTGYSDAMEDAFVAYYDHREHVFVYTWTPSPYWPVSIHDPGEDVVWIEVPFGAHPGTDNEDDLRIGGVDGCVNDNDPCFLGWPANDIMVVANSRFLDEHPDVEALFNAVSIPIEDISFQIWLMLRVTEDIDGYVDTLADTWIMENRYRGASRGGAPIDDWLAPARQASQ